MPENLYQIDVTQGTHTVLSDRFEAQTVAEACREAAELLYLEGVHAAEYLEWRVVRWDIRTGRWLPELYAPEPREPSDNDRELQGRHWL